MPPGDYDKEDLLPSHAHIKETTAEIRRRQSRMYPPSQPRESNFTFTKIIYSRYLLRKWLWQSKNKITINDIKLCPAITFLYDDINVKIKEKPNHILKVLP